MMLVNSNAYDNDIRGDYYDNGDSRLKKLLL